MCVDKFLGVNVMNREENRFPGILFNFLILITFGFLLFLIKSIQRGSDGKPVSNKTFIKKPITKEKEIKKVEPKAVRKFQNLNSRQQMIMAEIQKVGEITPKELKNLIPDVSTRTIRRDMDTLSAKGYITQRGSTKSTYYQYKA